MSKKADMVERREFLKKGLTTAAVGLGCLRFGLKEALARAAITGKPVLTEANLNALIPTDPSRQRVLALEAKRDLKPFVRRHLTLTPEQERNLEAMAQTEVAKVRGAMDLALRRKYRMEVKFNPPKKTTTPHDRTGSGGRLRKLPERTSSDEPPGWKVGGVEIKGEGSYSGSEGFEGIVSISFDY